MERIDTVRNDLKVLLGEGLDMALKRLGEEIDPGSPKFDIYIQLKSRYSAYLSLTIIGGTAQKELDQTYNALGASLLTFINTLQEQDLKSQQEAAPPAASKRGELLYNIPHEMQEQHEHRCAVRVAYEETALLEGWKAGKEDVRRQVRVAEVMAVEMLNVSSDQPFE
ncbi:MAG: hypothetical protein KDC65_17090, partial [Saprospiraceae bacterium]|nr:hypothetical protein [Saprospiraceae bacterium]